MEVTMDATQAMAACAGCGAALADDQRYCLHCGAPQGDPRVAYRELIAPAVATPAPAAAPPVAGAPAPPAASPARDWTPVIALGGLGALALVLVVGVLIGRSGTTARPAAAPAPQVITIGGVAPAASDTSGTAESDSGSGDAKGKGKQDDADAVDTKAGAKAVDDLSNASGEDYQKKSAKLPDTVALPGKPPPKDNKAPGGGSDAEVIG
jgi:hypothetical protein